MCNATQQEHGVLACHTRPRLAYYARPQVVQGHVERERGRAAHLQSFALLVPCLHYRYHLSI